MSQDNMTGEGRRIQTEMNKSILNKIMNDLHIQAAGNGFTDLICPKENIEKFIDEIDRLNIRIIGITWWCHVTEGHEPCGMGGPKNKFGSGWYSEVPLDDLIRFESNEHLRKYLLEEYPVSEAYKECFVPAFWLEG